jgi:hypothetical protein
VEGEPLEHA